jgi:hypothetical protein
VAQHLWGDTGLLQGSLGASFDSMSSLSRTPCKVGEFECYLQSYFGGVGYTQIVSPVFIVQASVEAGYLTGFQANLYRSVPGHGYEVVPDTRMRLAVAPRAAYYFPSTGSGVQLHYRYYRDTWSVDSHTVEGRFYQELTDNLELRLSFRQYFQMPADFWCDWMTAVQSVSRSCYGPDARYYPGDPKLAPVRTSMPEVRLSWEAASLRDTPFFGWFAAGTFEISYARYIKSTASLGDAHLVQVGYSIPY